MQNHSWPEVLNAAQSRALDQFALEGLGIPGLVLMENAGRGLAELLIRQNPRQVTVVAGRGNNGGDGLVIARHLDGAGVSVRVILAANPQKLSPDCAANWTMVTKAGIETHFLTTTTDASPLLQGSDWLVDALVGTGLQGPLKSPLAELVLAINATGANIFAVDLPSGLNADTGEPMGATIRARLTGTMACLKPGLVTASGRLHAGEVEVIGLGLPRMRDNRWLI